MKSRMVTYLTSMILAMAMILSSGFDVCAEILDSEIEIEFAESISSTSGQENEAATKVIENKPAGGNALIIRKLDQRRIINPNITAVDRQMIFCNFRE